MATNAQRLYKLESFSRNEITELVFLPCGTQLLCLSADGSFVLLDTSTGEAKGAIQYGPYTHPTSACWVTIDGKKEILVGSTDGLVLSLDVTESFEIDSLHWMPFRFPESIRRVRTQSREDGGLLIAVAFGDTVELWTRLEGEHALVLYTSLNDVKDAVENIWFLSEQRLLLSFFCRGLMLWDTSSAALIPIQIEEPKKLKPTTISDMSCKGNFLLRGQDGLLCVYDLGVEDRSAKLVHSRTSYCAGDACFVDVAEGACVALITGHTQVEIRLVRPKSVEDGVEEPTQFVLEHGSRQGVGNISAFSSTDKVVLATTTRQDGNVANPLDLHIWSVGSVSNAVAGTTMNAEPAHITHLPTYMAQTIRNRTLLFHGRRRLRKLRARFWTVNVKVATWILSVILFFALLSKLVEAIGAQPGLDSSTTDVAVVDHFSIIKLGFRLTLGSLLYKVGELLGFAARLLRDAFKGMWTALWVVVSLLGRSKEYSIALAQCVVTALAQMFCQVYPAAMGGTCTAVFEA